MIGPETPLVLGSASPRRREILTGLGIPITVLPAEVTEDVELGEAPPAYLKRIVEEKLRAVAERAGREPAAGLMVADTIVVLNNVIFGKPHDVRDAERLLGELSGKTHVVQTRYALAVAGQATVLRSRTVTSRVTLRRASPQELRRYAETGEGLDKAGAYAVQGIGSFLVERIDGSYTNVVGLPACEVIVDLLETGLLDHFP